MRRNLNSGAKCVRIDDAGAITRRREPSAVHRHTLREPRVFRVGRIAIDCEIVGTDAAGNVVGLHTLAVET